MGRGSNVRPPTLFCWLLVVVPVGSACACLAGVHGSTRLVQKGRLLPHMMAIQLGRIEGEFGLSSDTKSLSKKSRLGGATGPLAIVGFIVAVVVLGVFVSLVFTYADDPVRGVKRLVVIGAVALVVGTLTQMTISWVDPSGVREARWLEEEAEARKALKGEATAGAGAQAIGKEAFDSLTEMTQKTLTEITEKDPDTLPNWKERRALRKFRKAVRQKAIKEVDTVLAAEVSNLKRREWHNNFAALGWAALALGSIMLAFGAGVDLLRTPSPSAPVSCEVEMVEGCPSPYPSPSR